MFDTVDGRNPATVDMVNTYYLRGFIHPTGGWEWDFFHQQWLDLMQSPLLKRLKLPGARTILLDSFQQHVKATFSTHLFINKTSSRG